MIDARRTSLGRTQWIEQMFPSPQQLPHVLDDVGNQSSCETARAAIFADRLPGFVRNFQIPVGLK